MADDTILETRQLTKEFKGFVAVKDVSLSIRKGLDPEMMLLCGTADA